MDISSISQYYELKPLSVTPDLLLLDPNNPRIVLDINTDRQFTRNELTSPDVQEYILSVINKQAHHIAELIQGIRASGFIDMGEDMIVKRLNSTGGYLVLEGNRRTTAIKHLLNEADKLSPVVRKTLATLRVKEFLYRPNTKFTEEAVIDILLGTIHLTGHLAWGAIERAYYIYKSYIREMKKTKSDFEFNYIPSCCREVASLFNLSVNTVRKEITVYRVYEQLKEEGFDVMPHHFSLIDLGVTDRVLSEQYFELSPITLQLSNRGLARFDKLCVRESRPINNPRDFRDFSKVFKHGTDYERMLVESNEQPVAMVVDRLKQRQEEREFLNQLKEIKVRIEALRPADCRGVSAEKEMIQEIKRLVDGKLWNLTRSY